MSKIQEVLGNALKRKRNENDTTVAQVTTTSPSLDEEVDAKHDSNGQAMKRAARSSETEDVNEAIRHLDNILLSDHFAKQIKRHLGDLSTIELDQKYLPSTAFLNTSEFDESRKQSALPEYIKKFTPGGEDELKDTTKATSSPHTLVIASSGIRAADLTRSGELKTRVSPIALTSVSRSLRVYQSDEAAVAKLFAKHIKLADSVDYVKKTRIGIGVGTPARIQDLIKSDTLKTDNLKRIVIDGSYLDQKKRSIFDMKEIFAPLLDLLSRRKLKKRYENGTLQVMVF